jgi:CopG family nickel-responsive transcriptional regulator
MEEGLLKDFDRMITRRKWANRSEAIRDLVRRELIQSQWQEAGRQVVGTVTMLYDHHKRELPERLIDMQHHHAAEALSSLHIHLDERNCLEVVVVSGKPAQVRALADSLISAKGVKHGELVMSGTGKNLP